METVVLFILQVAVGYGMLSVLLPQFTRRGVNIKVTWVTFFAIYFGVIVVALLCGVVAVWATTPPLGMLFWPLFTIPLYLVVGVLTNTHVVGK